MSDREKLVRSAWGITAWTTVSRVAGLLRDTLIAKLLGASAASDAFYTALRIPNTFRSIVGEGGLPGALVPIAKKVERERPGEEGLYAGKVLTFLVLVLLPLTTLGIVFAPALVDLFAHGYRQTPGKFELTVRLTRFMFPYILVVAAAALLEAYLNAKGRFQLSAATPIVWNIAIIGGALFLVPLGVSVPLALALGVLTGGVLQFAMQVPAVRRLGFRFGVSPAGDPEVKRTALQIAPRLYGYGIGQISFLVSSRTLSALGDAFYTYNFYAYRIVEFVLGGFVVSIQRAILPSLSEQALETDRSEYARTVVFGLRLTAFVTLPATMGLALVAQPLVDVAFRRGKFTPADVVSTALALLFFSLGLFAAAGVKILTQAFYALHDTRTPVAVGTFDLAAFWVLCVTLAVPLRHAGVALATSAGFWINFLLLFFLLRRRLGRIGGRELLASVGRLLLATAAMGGVTFLVAERLLPYHLAWALPVRIAWLAGIVALGAASFLGSALVLGAPEVREVLGVVKRRKAA